MTINIITVQYNGGFLSDIILLTLCYYFSGTRLNPMKKLCPYSQCPHQNVLIFPPSLGACSGGLDAFIFFFKNVNRGIL